MVAPRVTCCLQAPPCQAMETMREAWTDDRMDDLNHKVDEGFRRVETDIRELRGEMNTRFERVDARFDSMQRTLIVFCGGIIVALLGVIASIVSTGA